MNKLINLDHPAESKLNKIMESLEGCKINYIGINATSVINFIISNFEFKVCDYIETLEEREEGRKTFLEKNKDYYKNYRENKKYFEGMEDRNG